MKWVSVAFMVILFGCLGLMLSCTQQQIHDTAEEIRADAAAAAPLLPGPFGIIAGAAAGLAGIVSSLTAGKSKGAAVAAGADPHPVANFLSSHSWIYPSITAVVGVAHSMGWIHVSPVELGTFATAMGLATVTQVASDSHAENQTPIAPSPTA